MKSIPASLLRDLRHIHGFDEISFLDAHQQAAPTTVRLHPQKPADLFADTEQVPWCKSGLYMHTRPVFTLDPAYHAGAYYVQEASSMFTDHLLRQIIGDRKGLRVLDLCAAPGGKSTLIASLLDKDSVLISNDVIRSRATILEENMTRWGYMNTWVTSNDPRDIGRVRGYFDVIVADAPCSGSGLWRKDAQAIDEWSEANVQLCSERQHRIIADIWPALKSGGVLVYATCSYSPQEDEQVLDWLAGTYDVTTMRIPINEAWGITEVSSPGKSMTGYRFFPDKLMGEGFFIAAVRKNDIAEEIHSPRFKSRHDKKIAAQAAHLFAQGDLTFLQTGTDQYSAILPCHEPDLQLLQPMLYFRRAGLNAGNPTAKEWIPSHEVALSVDKSASLPCLDLDKEQALKYLKREDTGLSDIAKGWLLIRYEGLGLGWVKSLGNRLNNYLPKNWRIRMDIPA